MQDVLLISCCESHLGINKALINPRVKENISGLEVTNWRSGREEAKVLTVNDDLNHPEVNFSPGHDTRLAVVRALIGLLDAADLQVAAGHVPEPH